MWHIFRAHTELTYGLFICSWQWGILSEVTILMTERVILLWNGTELVSRSSGSWLGSVNLSHLFTPYPLATLLEKREVDL